MKGELIPALQWYSLLKMGSNEVLRTLQDSGYKSEVDELGVEKRDPSSLERALNKNLIRTFSKLYRICDERMQEVLHVYLHRYDMENFKTIIRGKMTGISDEEILGLLIPSVHHPLSYFETLVKKEATMDIVKALPFHLHLQKEAKLVDIENALDRHHFEELFLLAERLSGQGVPLREFIRAELDIVNLKMLLRLKRDGRSSKDILRYLIRPRPELISLADAENVREVLRELYQMKFTSVKGDESVSEEELLTRAEIDLDTSLLKKEVLLMHQYPLTVNVILGFLFAKEIEVRNLKVLLKGKQLGLDDSYLAQLVVV